jgi:hypothetical protein
MTCKSGALTHNGSRSSSIKVSTLSTYKTENALKFLETRMMKEEQLLSTIDTTVLTRDGRLSMLTLSRLKPRDLMKSSVSTLTDHSILSQNSHSTESLKCLVEPTWFSRDGETTRDNNNSGLTKSQRPLETTTGRTTASTFRVMETAAT